MYGSQRTLLSLPTWRIGEAPLTLLKGVLCKGLLWLAWAEWPVQPAHINVLELCTVLKSVLKVLLHFFQQVRCHHILTRTDSVSAAVYINRQGGVCSSALYRAVVELSLWPIRTCSVLEPCKSRRPKCWGRPHLRLSPPRRVAFTSQHCQTMQSSGRAQMELFVYRHNVASPRIDSPPAQSVGTVVGLAPERLILQGRGLAAAVINTIQCSLNGVTCYLIPLEVCFLTISAGEGLGFLLKSMQ